MCTFCTKIYDSINNNVHLHQEVGDMYMFINVRSKKMHAYADGNSAGDLTTDLNQNSSLG